jgi:hypothetical protein
MTAHPARSGIVLSLLVATAVVVTARPALAKGLESATIAGPGIDRPIELSDTPNLMVRLMEQTGLWYRNRRSPATGTAGRARARLHGDLDQFRRAR